MSRAQPLSRSAGGLPAATVDPSHARRFKQLTQAAHAALDQRIQDFEPFASRERYAAFLRVQLDFHRDVDALFGHAALERLLPGLGQRRRLPMVEQDRHDLGHAPGAPTSAPLFGAEVDPATALGWLYVEQGSQLGAAILYRMAAALGLDSGFGARHLAPHAEGRALNWRQFCLQLDAVPLDAAGRRRADAGALAAFACVRRGVELHCPLSAR